MGTIKHSSQLLLGCLALFISLTHSAVHDLNQAVDERPNLYRQARDDRYYQQRYGSSNSPDRSLDRSRDPALDRTLDRTRDLRRPSLKPEAHPEARGTDRDNEQTQGAGVEKRCIRCTQSYLDPYEYRDYYDRGYDRYDDRRYDDRRYDDRGYYDRYDRTGSGYYDRDRWYDRRPAYYDDRSYDRGYDRSYDRGYDRGFGYDNRGYDNRGWRTYDSRGSSGSYRPWDDTARGASGWDQYGRGGAGAGGYSNRPDYWGYDRNYASNYYYGRGDTYRDPYRRYEGYDGYRGTSYLYERQPTPVTTSRPPPSKDGDVSNTERPGGDGKPDDVPSTG